MLIVQNGEKPSAQIGAGLPEMRLGQCAHQAALNKVVGACGVACQGAGVPAQSWYLVLETAPEIGHYRPLSIWLSLWLAFVTSPDARKIMGQRIVERCNRVMYRG